MIVRNAVIDAVTPFNLMSRVREGRQLRTLAAPMTLRELHQRADMIAKVIRARSKLQRLRNRADALECALARFKAHHEAMHA